MQQNTPMIPVIGAHTAPHTPLRVWHSGCHCKLSGSVILIHYDNGLMNEQVRYDLYINSNGLINTYEKIIFISFNN